MAVKTTTFASVIILVFSIGVLLRNSLVIAYDTNNYCDDWTVCSRAFCVPAPEKCPEETPFRVLNGCGCCETCSDSPRQGPCGTCGVDVKCKEGYPACNENEIVSIDYCGCCRICKTLIEEGQECRPEEPAVCRGGLQCINGICTKRIYPTF